MPTPKQRTSALFVIALAAIMLGACGSPRTTGVGDASLEQGIVAFIDGDLDRAETILLKLTRESRSDTDLQTAYLYLGRIYLARGDYVGAAEALSAGKALGGDVRFDEYFAEAQRHLSASRPRIARLEPITRGQLAAVIEELFGVPGAGAVGTLPDGELHPDDLVTRPAFYVIVSRLAKDLGAGEETMRSVYAGGYRGALDTANGSPGGAASGEFITGREAIGTLETLAGLLGNAKGK